MWKNCKYIGGGWAGLSSALLLSEKMSSLFESAANLGGRARSFKQKDDILDNGSHLLFLNMNLLSKYLIR